MATLNSTRAFKAIEHFQITRDGLLLVANGLDPVLRWDGLTAAAETAGIAAATTAPTLQLFGVAGATSVSYSTYVRFKDRYGNYSDLSPVPTAVTGSFNRAVLGVTVTVVGLYPSQIGIGFSGAHGLSSGAFVKVTGVVGISEANGYFRINVNTPNSFLLEDYSTGAAVNGTGSYTSGGTVYREIAFLHTSVPVSSDTKVTARQILRNTNGQTETYYVDLETTDLSSTTLTTMNDDTDLATEESQAILGSDGSALANRYGVPPNHKPFMAQTLDRVFYMGYVDYSEGNVILTNGSATVTGTGTRFTSSMVGRMLYVIGSTASYEISAVDTTAQTLTLTAVYAGTTNKYGRYTIRPATAELKAVYFSESGLPEAVPATNALTIQEDGDKITGGMAFKSFIYILERRHIYKLTSSSDPATDGSVYLQCERGCINNRCWVIVNEAAYLLDESGVYKYQGGSQAESISSAIQNMFFPEDDGEWRIQWTFAKNFHASVDSNFSVIRWFVCLSGSEHPRHAICYQYELGRWWVEEFTQPMASSVVGESVNDNIRRVFVGSFHKKVMGMGRGDLDVVSPGEGRLRGTATSGEVCSLTDSASEFALAISTYRNGSINAPVAIIDGRGKGQWRRVVEITDTDVLGNFGAVLRLDRPWNIVPDDTSIYQIGGIQWRISTRWFRYTKLEDDQKRRIEVVFIPTKNPCIMDMRFRHDFAADPTVEQISRNTLDGEGVRITEGETDSVADMTKAKGVVEKIMTGHRESSTEGRRFWQFELAGVTSLDLIRVCQVTCDGFQAPGAQPGA